MSTFQFTSLEPEQLQKQIAATVKLELATFFKDMQQQPDEWLTRDELKTMLKVSISTINNWKKSGKLIAYGIGNKVYFRRSEVEKLMKPLNV